ASRTGAPAARRSDGLVARAFSRPVLRPARDERDAGCGRQRAEANPADERGRTGACQGKAGARLCLARRATCRKALGCWRRLYAGGLCRGAFAVLCGLDAPHIRDLPGAACLPRAVARPPILRPRGGGRAAVPAELPPGSSGPGLT